MQIRYPNLNGSVDLLMTSIRNSPLLFFDVCNPLTMSFILIFAHAGKQEIVGESRTVNLEESRHDLGGAGRRDQLGKMHELLMLIQRWRRWNGGWARIEGKQKSGHDCEHLRPCSSLEGRRRERR